MLCGTHHNEEQNDTRNVWLMQECMGEGILLIGFNKLSQADLKPFNLYFAIRQKYQKIKFL